VLGFFNVGADGLEKELIAGIGSKIFFFFQVTCVNGLLNLASPESEIRDFQHFQSHN
jgi:hypothetical protein